MKRLEAADLACLVMVLIWGSNLSLVKDALAEVSPMSFNAARLAVGSLVLAGITWLIEGRIEFHRKDWKILTGLGLLGNTVYQSLFIEGVHRTKAGNVALLLSTAAIFIALLSWAFGHERLGRLVWSGILLSLGGVGMILLESSALQVTGATVAGDALILACSLCWAAYTVFARELMRSYSPLSFTTLTFAGGSAFYLLMAAPSVASENWADVSARSYAEMAFSAFMALSVGYALWFFAVSRIGGTRAAIYNNLIPFVGVGVAWLFLGESITALQLAGGGCVLTGIYLSRRKPAAKLENAGRRT